ncbi:MAG: hypothetical protein ABI359_12985 [Ginsengibacter sp.]
MSLRMLEKYGKNITLCPKCNRGELVLISISYPMQNNNIPLKKKDKIIILLAASPDNAPP